MQSVVPSLRRLIGLTRRLANDTRGAILLFSAILLIFVLGTGGLILDFARVWNAQSELQSFADHAALVAAGELDGNPGAIARANDALDRLITDRQHYANEAVGLDSGSVTARFLRDLPANDTDNNLAPFVTANDALARFVHVQLNPYTVSTMFADILLTISGNAGVDIGVGATAVAGYTQFVCDITPMMFCTPGPGYVPEPGRMINMVSGNFWGPGAFGLLDLNFDPNGPCGAPNQGANFFRCALGASQGVTRCFERRGVDIRPGRMVGAASSGFNTRFDQYQTSLQSESNNSVFAPAPNVIKGEVPRGGNACNNNTDPSPDTMALPRDTCFGSGETCGGSRFGNGTWDQAGYQATNHNGAFPNGIGNGATRYEMYLAEIAAAGGGRILPAGKAESGVPACNTTGPAGPERRLMIAAGIDCSGLPPGNASNVPVQTFVQVFLTEPAGTTGNDSNVWVEEVAAVDGFGEAGNGVIRDVVQLYR
jgi:Flp pilus assembly protein TadG